VPPSDGTLLHRHRQVKLSGDRCVDLGFMLGSQDGSGIAIDLTVTVR
jgi:hypothetical protein